MLTYVDHHDDAYKWAANRVIRKHPRTGAAQIIEIKEATNPVSTSDNAPHSTENDKLFIELDSDLLALIGVPEEFVAQVQACDEAMFLN